jgi:hypothetical protein
MTLPRLNPADRAKLKAMTLERSQVLPAGKVWFCAGRDIVLKTNLSLMEAALVIPHQADTLAVSAADFPAIREWIG